jgi:hypothetical protein
MTREDMVMLLERYDKLKPKNATFIVRPHFRYGSWGNIESIDFDAYKLHKTKKEEWEDFECTLLTVEAN